MRPDVEGERTRPDIEKEGTKPDTERERTRRVDVESSADTERSADAEEFVVIYYKHQYEYT